MTDPQITRSQLESGELAIRDMCLKVTFSNGHYDSLVTGIDQTQYPGIREAKSTGSYYYPLTESNLKLFSQWNAWALFKAERSAWRKTQMDSARELAQSALAGTIKSLGFQELTDLLNMLVQHGSEDFEGPATRAREILKEIGEGYDKRTN